MHKKTVTSSLQAVYRKHRFVTEQTDPTGKRNSTKKKEINLNNSVSINPISVTVATTNICFIVCIQWISRYTMSYQSSSWMVLSEREEDLDTSSISTKPYCTFPYTSPDRSCWAAFCPH